MAPGGSTCLGLGVIIAANGLQLAGVVVGRAGKAPSRRSAVPLDQRCSKRRDLMRATGIASASAPPKCPAWGRHPALWDGAQIPASSSRLRQQHGT